MLRLKLNHVSKRGPLLVYVSKRDPQWGLGAVQNVSSGNQSLFERQQAEIMGSFVKNDISEALSPGGGGGGEGGRALGQVSYGGVRGGGVRPLGQVSYGGVQLRGPNPYPILGKAGLQKHTLF